MIPIRVKLCPQSRYGIKCPYTRTPTRIVVHNTANDAPASNEIAYMIRNDEQVSYHYAVDDIEAVQGLPLNRNAWASGDGHGKGNMEGIHIEICYSKSGGQRFKEAEQNAAQLIAQLLKQYGWGIDKVTKHQDYDGKYCPHRTLDLGWKRFLDIVGQYYEGDDDMTEEKVLKIIEKHDKAKAEKAASDWAKAALEFCRESGIMAGEKGGKMRPQSNITRQEVAQMLFNFAGAGLSASGYAAEVWQRAVTAGIFDGTNPRAPLTREQFAVILGKLNLIPRG